MTDQRQINATPGHGARRVQYLDGWRGISIACVFIGHFLPLSFISSGLLGVDLFFVLSGRLMAEILFIDKFPLAPFYRRRIARVWPAMLVFLLVMRVAFNWSDTLYVRTMDVLSALTLTLNYVCLYVHRMPVIENVWSLCIEEWAYILLGLLAYVTRQRGGNVALILIVAAVICMINGVVSSLSGLDYYAVYWRTDTRIAGILMSAGLYLWLRQGRRQVPSWLPILAGMAGLVLYLKVFPDSVRFSVGTSCFCLAVATIDQAPKWLLSLLSNRYLRQVGLWSFSFYLWQQPFYYMHLRHYAPGAVMLPAALICGVVSFYCIEQPARRFLNERWGKQKPALVAG